MTIQHELESAKKQSFIQRITSLLLVMTIQHEPESTKKSSFYSTDYFAIARNDDATNRYCDEPASAKK